MMPRRTLASLLTMALCASLAACGEKPQTATGRKSDTKASEGPATAFTASGWKPGDANGWEQQLKARSQGQNEYARTGAH